MNTSLKQNFITNENLNDALFYNSLIEELEKIIEEELSKSYEDVNAGVIDDCCLALDSIYALQNGGNIELKNITNINTIIKKYNLEKRKKYVASAACAAAVFIIGISGVNFDSETLAEGNIFKTAIGRIESFVKNEEPTIPLTTEPEITNSVQEFTSEFVTQLEPMTSQDLVSDKNIKIIKGIYAIIVPGTNTIYNSTEDISLKNTFVGVNYTSGETETINISKCDVKIGEPKSDGETKITISYNGFETYIYVTVLSEEKQNPVTLTSIYGIFTDEYTIDDMGIVAVYSDGSEVEIDKSKCEIQKEFLSDTNEYIITVSYGDCSFQFLMEGEVTE